MTDAAVAVIEDGVIIIRVPVENLANALNLSPDPISLDYRITDCSGFARDVVRALNDENPDNGTTPIHRLLDSAMEAAIEGGSEFVREATQADFDALAEAMSPPDRGSDA